MPRVYRIVIHRTEPGESVPYWVECPAFGIASLGDSVEDAIAMMREAIELNIEGRLADAEPLPPPDAPEMPASQAVYISLPEHRRPASR